MKPVIRVTATAVGPTMAVTVFATASTPEAAWEAASVQVLGPFQDERWGDSSEDVLKVLVALHRD